MYVVGLTGPMGAGKSVVLDVFRQLGAECLRADDASRELLDCDTRLLIAVGKELGPCVLQEDGSLDRRRTAQLIFADPGARARLEAVMHPPMVHWLRSRLACLSSRKHPPEIVVLEAAILTHMGVRPLTDTLVRVDASRGDCLARIQARDGLSPQQASERLALHEQLGLFTEPADHILSASGSLEETRRRVRSLWGRLSDEARRSGHGP